MLVVVALAGGGVSYAAGTAIFGAPGDTMPSSVAASGLVPEGVSVATPTLAQTTPAPSPSPPPAAAVVSASSTDTGPADPPATAQTSRTIVTIDPPTTPTPDSFAKCDAETSRQDRKECRDEVKEDLEQQGGKGKQKVECEAPDQGTCKKKEK